MIHAKIERENHLLARCKNLQRGMHMSCIVRLLFYILLCTCALSCSAAITVVYPADEIPSDTRFADLKEILHTALEKTVQTYGPYELHASATGMNEARYLAQLEVGQIINIAWSSTSKEKENALLPIRIPLRKGLLGYRIALIASANQGKIDEVRTTDDLRKLIFGQGLGWGDVGVYEANGIKVRQANYDNLFKMTSVGRIDLFPRGIGEIFAEYEHYAKDNPTLAIEKHLLIYYPWPYYFFVNKKDAALADRIKAGLEIMRKDGSFDAIFLKYNSESIKKADIRNRRVIHLDNPELPPETPLNDASLWYVPSN
jgi:hypothetical protein